MSSISILLISSLVVGILASCSNKNLGLGVKVSGTDLLFPCPSTKNIYTSTGRYISKNIIATRLQIHEDSAIVALPRYRPGVPFTVAKFNLSKKGSRALLKPYPSWSIQEEGNCNAIQNAIDLVVDPVDRIWILDLGICNTLEHPVKRCDPKIWSFNVTTGELIKTVDLSPFVTTESRLQYLVIDYNTEGVPFAFISDAGTGALIVINISNGLGYRLLLPAAVTAHCSLKDILYLQLARKSSGNILYLSYLSSPKLFSIMVRNLQNGQPAGAVMEVGSKPADTQMVLLGTDNGLAIFFRYKGESDIYVWNSDKEFKEENFVLVQNGGDCRLPTQVVSGWNNLMWVIESNSHDFVTNSTGCMGPNVAVYPLVKKSD